MFNKNIQTQVEYATLPLIDFRHGLNTSVSADRIAPTEASKLVNWKIRKGGGLVSRPPVIRYSTVATIGNAAVKTIEEVNIGGTTYVLFVDENYVLYYLDVDLEPVAIGALEGDTTIMSYNGVAMLFDGSYLKYLSGVTSIKICYDGGTGASGVQFTNLALTQDTHLVIGNGTNTRAAQKFTSQVWTTGYTIPITQIDVYLDKEATPTGGINAVLRKVSDGSSMATKALCDCSEITAGTPAKFTAVFTSSDISTEMSPNTAYYASIECAAGYAGDVGNYVKVMCYNCTSGGLSYYYDGSWHADTAKNCVMSVSPGKPPKGKFGAIWNRRPFVAGDPDNPGYVWYGNLTHLDWSTTDGGGYVGMIDSNNDNFEVGGLKAFYGDLYVFGTQSQPYLSKISGTSPSDYAQSLSFQRPWATHLTLTDAVNDIWYFTNEGAVPISGVQEYGDLRAMSETDPVSDRFDDYWTSSTAIAGYYPVDGQIWLVLDYHRVVVIHTKNPAQDPSGTGIRYPRSEYELYLHNLSSSSYTWIKSQSGTNEYFVSAPQYEDWTEYTERDLNGHITVAANTITADLGLGEDAYVYYDLGGDIISGDFEYRVKAKINSGNGIAVFAGFSDTVADLFSLQTAGGHEICVKGYGDGSNYVIYLSESYGVYEGTDWLSVDAGVDYYLKVVRDETVGTNGTVYCYVYSDENYSVLVDTLTLALSGKYDYRYIMAAQSYCIGGVEQLNITISNLIVYERAYDPGFDPQPDYVTIDNVVSTEGTVGSLTNHQWDYDDNDALGFSTVYISDVSGNPNKTYTRIRTILKPQSFGKSGSYFLIGGSDGYLYRIDDTDYKDMSTIQLRPILRTAYLEMPFTRANFNEFQLYASTVGGAYVTIDFYTNGIYGTKTLTKNITLAVKDNLTVEEAIMDVEDAWFLIDPASTAPLFQYVNFNGRSVMAEMVCYTAGYPFYNNGILLKYRGLSY
ncbi:MAG: hypothetical protein SVV67_08725 [Bacillota bacterium]|nr:hypothetical protein [Bacillota bacterium]